MVINLGLPHFHNLCAPHCSGRDSNPTQITKPFEELFNSPSLSTLTSRLVHQVRVELTLSPLGGMCLNPLDDWHISVGVYFIPHRLGAETFLAQLRIRQLLPKCRRFNLRIFKVMVPHKGLEPSSHRLRVCCSNH